MPLAVRVISPPGEFVPLPDVSIVPTVIWAPEISTSAPEAVMDCVGSIEKAPPLLLSESAVNVTELAELKVKETPGAMVILSVASRTISPDCFSRVATLIVISSLPGVFFKVFTKSLANSGSLSAALEIVIFFGSSSKVPQIPLGAVKSTKPLKIRFSLPETSAKPPLPKFSPPRAEIWP